MSFRGSAEVSFSMDLVHPHRLLFTSTEELDRRSFDDEVQRWRAIKSITIVAVEDTHG
jgi:hypothetical protein